MASEKKNGMGLPQGIFASTTQLEPEVDDAEQGGQAQPDESPIKAKGSKARKKKDTDPTGADIGDDGAKLYLSSDVRFRLRMQAYKQGKKISTVANEILDKTLPRWNLERSE